MTVIKYNSDCFTNEVLPCVEDAMEYLQTAYRYASSLIVPSDFNYRTYLTNLPSKINDRKNDLSTFKSWTLNLKKAYDGVNVSQQERIDAIDDSLLKKRNRLS